MTATPDGPVADPRFSEPRTLAFGIGAQKSGTTWLGDYFSHHPDVHMSHKKEIHYWNSVRPPHDTFPEGKRKASRKHANRLLTEGTLVRRLYRQIRLGKVITQYLTHADTTRDKTAPYTSYADMLMLGYRKQAVAMEITPAYARLNSETFAEMAALAPDVRFIFLMRDPLDRLVSGVRHHQRIIKGRENVSTKSVENLLKRILKKPTHPILERSRYDVTIKALESVVPADRIFYGFFETFFNQDETDRLCDFLGVRHQAAETDKKVFVATDRTGLLSADLLKEAAEKLQPVYDFTRARFPETPDAWQTTRGI